VESKIKLCFFEEHNKDILMDLKREVCLTEQVKNILIIVL